MVKILSQSKEKTRGVNELFIDLHFHLGTNKNIHTVLKQLSSVADIIALTGRGNRFQNTFEYDFKTFRNVLKAERISHEQIHAVAVKVWSGTEPLIVIKAQEIYTSEGVDIVVVGSERDFLDDIPYEKLLSDSEQAIRILSTPYHKPNTLTFRKEEDQMIKKVAENVDGIEIFNQNFVLSRANKLAKKLSKKINKPGIAVSDSHLYAKKNFPVYLSGIITPREQIKISEDIISSLKETIAQRNFRNHPVSTPWALFEFGGLHVREMKSLYYGNKR